MHAWRPLCGAPCLMLSLRPATQAGLVPQATIGMGNSGESAASPVAVRLDFC